MTNPKLDSSTQPNLIPEKWREKYFIKRIGEDDIEISLEERNSILQMLQAGMRFVQIGKYTIMLNSIKSIDPKWGETNIPPRPTLKEDYKITFDEVQKKGVKTLMGDNRAEIEEWDKCFAPGAPKLLR